MFDQDSSSVVRSLIGLVAFRSNPVSKVCQHRSCNGGMSEVAWSTGSLRKNSKRHCCWRVNTQSISATCKWNRPKSNTRQMEVYSRISPSLTRWWIISITWIDGLLRCPKFDVVCLGSCPRTIMLGLMRRNASITTYNVKQTFI